MNPEIGYIWQKKQFKEFGNVSDVLEILDIAQIIKNDSSIMICSGEYMGQELPSLDNFQETDEIMVTTNEDFYHSFLSYSQEEVLNGQALKSLKDYSYVITKTTPRKVTNLFGETATRVKSLFHPNNPRGNTCTNTANNGLFSYNIEDKYGILKKSIYGQDEPLKSFLVYLIKNIDLSNHNYDKDFIASLKSNILLCGPTGCGKTLMIKKTAQLFDIPYVIEDAKRYTEVGYKGENVENMLLNLYIKSEKILERAETGILFIDEFDKLCREDKNDKQVSTIAVQQSLLKIMEGTEVSLTYQYDPVIFNTSRLTVVLAGAFDKIKAYDRKTLNNYGMISEILGRTTIIPMKLPGASTQSSTG